MDNNKETKKGFWSTLFAAKKKNCCNSNLIEEESVRPAKSCECTPTSSNSPNAKANEVIVLGPGCSKCKETYKVVERVITEANLTVSLSKIEDITEIMSYNIITTPAVVIDGTVRIKGHVPTVDEVKKALGI